MKYTTIKLIQMSAIVLMIAACASSKTKKEDAALNAEVQAQAPADTPDQIMQRASYAFANAEGLTPEQKIKLGAIYSRVYTEGMSIRREIGQSKSLLFSVLAKVDYKADEITKLKKKIVDLDQKRLAIMFTALEEVQAVVGKGEQAAKIYKHLEHYENPLRSMREGAF